MRLRFLAGALTLTFLRLVRLLPTAALPLASAIRRRRRLRFRRLKTLRGSLTFTAFLALGPSEKDFDPALRFPSLRLSLPLSGKPYGLVSTIGTVPERDALALAARAIRGPAARIEAYGSGAGAGARAALVRRQRRAASHARVLGLVAEAVAVGVGLHADPQVQLHAKLPLGTSTSDGGSESSKTKAFVSAGGLCLWA